MAGTEFTLSVSNLNDYVNSLLSNDVRLRSVKVQGEISSLKTQYGSGHLYFTLKDELASIRCVMFRSRAAVLRFEPQDGMKVTVSGRVEIYSPSGQYSFNVTSMRETGEGELLRQFLQLRDKLEHEGLFNRKRSIPKLPGCVGIVTSESGAAIHDIINVINRRYKNMDMVFSPAIVQGNDAPMSLISALNALVLDGRADVIIIGRGGGSYEELSCFNDEALARAVFNCPIPTISAVGHDIDYTIIDFVADLRAPTPSAAAEICVPVYDELYGIIKSTEEQLNKSVNNIYDSTKRFIDYCKNMSVLRAPDSILEARRNRLEKASDAVEHAMQLSLASNCAAIENIMIRLEALNPQAVLKRGYAVIKNESGHVVSSVDQLKSGDKVDIILGNGNADAIVINSPKATNGIDEKMSAADKNQLADRK